MGLQKAEIPELPLSEQDRKEVEETYQSLMRTEARLVGPDGSVKALPGSLYQFLVQLIENLAKGTSVSIVHHDTKLTTVEAAHILGVSRQFFVNQLERGEIPFHLVGTHRRIYARDLLAYKAQRDRRRRDALSDLAKSEVESGTYFD